MYGSILIRWFFVGFTIFENESACIGISMKEKKTVNMLQIRQILFIGQTFSLLFMIYAVN